MRKIKRRDKERYRDLVTRRVLPEAEYERSILAFMIMDDSICEAAYNFFESGLLKLNYFSPQYRRQYRSVFNYYKKYEQAPKRTIKYLHDIDKIRLKDDEIQANEEVLRLVASTHAASREGYETNPDYILKDVLPQFIQLNAIKE